MKPISLVLLTVLLLPAIGLGGARTVQAQSGSCVGDCGGDERVTVDEIVTEVAVALESLPMDTCSHSPGGVTTGDLTAAVSNALNGCSAGGNRAPQASDVSFGIGNATAYVEKQLIGSDPDGDTIAYELVGAESGTGYDFAYVNPQSGLLYLTITANFSGTLVLPYHVTDGQRFSNLATATLEVQAEVPVKNGGSQDIDARTYAEHPRAFYDGNLLGAPGADPALPSSVDLSDDFPKPGDQGRQSSCVGWALAYAIKTYQERVELGWSLEAPEHRFSPAYIYNQINFGMDVGSRYSDGLDLVVDQGVATLARMPYNPLDFLTQPSSAARDEAAQFRALRWRTANGTLEIKSALANHLGVFIVVQIFDELYGLKGPASVYNTVSGPFRGGHAVAAVGYDDQRFGGAFKIINSWSQNWGDGGYFWLPYSAATQTVATPNGPTPLMPGAVVIDDAPDPMPPPADPVDPPLPARLPDLQVSDWRADYDPMPGGSGALQYTVVNSGVATAPAGAYVALVLSQDPSFSSGNSLVVYEPIPFAMPPGTTAYRDQNNAIAFHLPENIDAGDYYLAAWADIWDDVLESNEADNLSPSNTTAEIVNTRADLEVLSWYGVWDAFGNGLLTYDVVNKGAATAPGGWLVTLALSGNDVIGDGDEIFLFSEEAPFALAPGATIYRDDALAAPFSLFTDIFGAPVPTGIYNVALWADPLNTLPESNEINNASLWWGTLGITVVSGTGPTERSVSPAEGAGSLVAPGEAYNGKILPPPNAEMRKVRISATPQGGRRIDVLDGGRASPRLKAVATRPWSKVARARQQVVFPVTARVPMPAVDSP